MPFHVPVKNVWNMRLAIAIVGCIIYIVVWCLAKLTAAVKYGQNNHTVILSMDTVILILFSLIQTCYIQNCISVYKNTFQNIVKNIVVLSLINKTVEL